MKFPTIEQVNNADREQICRWHRFLPTADNDPDAEVQKRLWERFNEVGGFTPELSKRIGW